MYNPKEFRIDPAFITRIHIQHNFLSRKFGTLTFFGPRTNPVTHSSHQTIFAITPNTMPYYEKSESLSTRLYYFRTINWWNRVRMDMAMAGISFPSC